MRGLERGLFGSRGGGCDEGPVVFGAGAGVDEGSVREGDGVYGVFRGGRWGGEGEGGEGGFVRVVEEEGASVGVPDVAVCWGLVGGGTGGQGEDLVVVWRGGALGHGD